MNKNNPLKILHLNCQSIVKPHKKIQLHNITNIYQPGIISLNETFLKPEIECKLDNYTVIRNDRQGGKTAFCIKNNLSYKTISHSTQPTKSQV